MNGEIIVTRRDARDLQAMRGNPHMVASGTGGVTVVPARLYAARHRVAGWQLLITHDDLIATDPAAAGYDPARPACLLTTFINDTLAAE